MTQCNNLSSVAESSANIAFLTEQPLINDVVKPLIHLKQAKPENAMKVVEFFAGHSEVAFCDWQDVVQTKRMLEKDTTVVFLAYAGTKIVGACFCGILGSRATVNHLAVNSEYRNNRIANKLVDASIGVIKDTGVKRLFLFVADDNNSAANFWVKQGFTETSAEITLERDI